MSTFNIALGGIALMYVLDREPKALITASMLVFIIMALDGLDGYLAKRTRSTPMGPFLDSVSDGLAFILVPSLLVYSYYYTPGVSSLEEPRNALVVGVLAFYIAIGFRRLSHFALGRRNTPYFTGAPVSLPALFLVAISALDAPLWLMTSGLLAITLLVLSPLRFPKLRGALMAAGALPVGLGIAAFYLIFLGEESMAKPFIWAILAMCGAYMISPVLWKEKGIKKREY